MKVIFIEDVPSVARVGQTKVVADGYARNFLLPRKLAVVADSPAAAAIESQLKKKIKQRELEEAEMAALAERISGVEITLKAKVGEGEKLYGSVTGADIAGELSKSAGREVDKRKIELAEPIRQTGSYDVTVRFTHDITAVIKVNVMSEEAVEEKPAKTEKKAKAKSGEAVKEKPGKAEDKSKAKSEETAEKKPPKKKKAKPEKARKEGKPEKEEKKEKKPRARAKKTEAAVAEKKEKESGE